MKKIILLILFLLCICSCKEKDIDKSKSISIEFDSNPSTGYIWSYELLGEDILTVTKDEFQGTSNEEILGSSGKQIYEIEGINEGTESIIFRYKRLWEETEYDQTWIYTIEVDENLNLKLINKRELN